MGKLTMEDDWGARGAQRTGAEIQTFIKDQLRSLIEKDTVIQNQVNELTANVDQGAATLRAASDGCYVAYYRKSDGLPATSPYWEWPDLESSGEEAVGVMVLIDGQEPLVVSLEERTLAWAANKNLVINAPTSGNRYLFSSFNGLSNTLTTVRDHASIFQQQQLAGASYAPTWCANYSKTYTDEDDPGSEVGIGKGKWWLPSITELLVLWRHMYAINLCLSVISGAQKLASGWYWSSTEKDETDTWSLHFADGRMKAFQGIDSVLIRTRAVASFYQIS